jgi:DNA-binding IclR family transcriptional regulator
VTARRTPSLTVAQLAERIGVDEPEAQRILDDLRSSGIARRDGKGRWRLTRRAQRWFSALPEVTP